MTVSFHKYGEYFPGTGDLRVRLNFCLNKYYDIKIRNEEANNHVSKLILFLSHSLETCMHS